jgi:hypothetical protein
MREDPDVTSHVFDAHRCLAEYCLYGERGHEPLAELGQELMELAELERSIQGRALASLLIGEVSLLSGRLEEASVALTRAVELHAQAAAESGEVLSLQRLAELALTTGHQPDRQLLNHGLMLPRRAWLRPHVEVRMLGVLVEAAPAGGRCPVRLQCLSHLLHRVPPCSRAGVRQRRICGPGQTSPGTVRTAVTHVALWRLARRGLGDARPALPKAGRLFPSGSDVPRSRVTVQRARPPPRP